MVWLVAKGGSGSWGDGAGGLGGGSLLGLRPRAPTLPLRCVNVTVFALRAHVGRTAHPVDRVLATGSMQTWARVNVEAMGATLPGHVVNLFWEVDPASIDLDLHRNYVLERVMSRGGWDAMQWLKATYSRQDLATFLRLRGGRLAPRERAYWCLVAGVEVPTVPGGGRPIWAGK